MVKVMRYAGFAEEPANAFGKIDPPPPAAFHVDPATLNLESPNDPTIRHEGGITRGLHSSVSRPGRYSPAGNIGFPLDLSTIGWFLKWALGGYKFTAGSPGPPHLHEFWTSGESDLTSFTARLGKDGLPGSNMFEQVFVGCAVNSLQLQVEDQLAVLTLDVNAARDLAADLADVNALNLPSARYLTLADVAVSIAGADVSPKVRSLQVTIGNEIIAAAGYGAGSRFPRRQRGGGQPVSWRATIYWDSLDERARFWGAATGATDAGTAQFETVLTFTAGPDTLALRFPACEYEQVPVTPSGRGEATQQVQAIALQDEVPLAVGNVTTAVLGTLTNTHAQYALP